jgi:hypothetical protein
MDTTSNTSSNASNSGGHPAKSEQKVPQRTSTNKTDHENDVEPEEQYPDELEHDNYSYWRRLDSPQPAVSLPQRIITIRNPDIQIPSITITPPKV